ncbi:MAG: TIGR02996 domain-containing protein [Zavarzinella sp.]|nr:TIGR02996 domain-containing protein [Zavarzinella sp.]
MTDDHAFLEAIRAAPNDLAPRLVYADWLDDRNDPRGELIRIEEKMRTVPAFADRYWELKPRRNELRQQADPDWRAVFGYGTVARPLFGHGIPDDWKGRWRLIREFVERWHGKPMGDVTGDADDVRALEERLGYAFPPAVREWGAFAGEFRKDSEFPVVLRDLYFLGPVEDESGISLLLQADGDGFGWAVRYEDLGNPDPLVYEYGSELAGLGNPYRDHNQALYTVTAFFLAYVWGNVHGQGGSLGVEVDDPAPLIRELEATFPAQSRYRNIVIYEADDFLVQLYDNPGRAMGLEVEVARPMPREAVPAFLWEYAKRGGFYRGMFIPRGLRRA